MALEIIPGVAMRSARQVSSLLICNAALLSLGCNQGPQSVRVAPAVDRPDDVAASAIAAYDANADGHLSGDELKAFPGLLWSLGKFDADGDKRVSADEISQRVSQWVDEGAGLLSFACRVTLNGRPLDSAQVKLVPEECLGPGVKQAVGSANSDGMAQISLAAEDLPEGSTDRRVMQPGLYKVVITHPQVSVPARYNTQTQLGCEVAFDSNRTELPEFKLKAP